MRAHAGAATVPAEAPRAVMLILSWHSLSLLSPFYESDDKQCVHREQRSACTVTFAHVHSCLLHRWHLAFPLHDHWQVMGVVIYWLLARETRTGEAGGRLEDLKDMGGRRGGPLRLYRGTHFLSP